MSLLQFDISKCVRTTNKASSCTLCQECCPTKAITITQQIPSFIPSECIGCDGCNAICPNEAFFLDDFDSINAIFSFLEQQQTLLSCKENIPCLAAFSVEELISLALLIPQEQLRLNKSYCDECSIKEPNCSLIEQRVQEANFILKAIQSKKVILFEEFLEEKRPKEEDRRAFLSKLSPKEAIKLKQKFENEVEATNEELTTQTASLEDIKAIREQKEVPKRRKLLLMALKEHKPDIYHTISSEDITFSSMKIIDDSCDNCQMCYRICPTQALSASIKYDTIFFEAYKCIKCESCHDVCEKNAIVLHNVFDLKAFFQPQKQTLKRFSMRRCDECNLVYVDDGNPLCKRCRIEEEEAMNLWGIDPKMRSF